ncbi:MAG: transporter [Prevotella sp.]|nr:transporter [Prevotella sp.]
MKDFLNWKRLLLLAFVAAGLYILTKNEWITLGILFVLLVIDHFLAKFDEKQRNKYDQNEQDQ